MLRRAVVTAFLIWTIAAALVPVMRSAGRSGGARPACCANESTCPMHRKAAGRSFEACTCRDELTMLVGSERGVVRDGVVVAAADVAPRQFVAIEASLMSFDVAPAVPPPRA